MVCNHRCDDQWHPTWQHRRIAGCDFVGGRTGVCFGVALKVLDEFDRGRIHLDNDSDDITIFTVISVISV